MKQEKITDWIAKTLDVASFDDVSNNGVQIARRGEDVRKVAFAVDASAQSVADAVAAGAQLLVVHHGIATFLRIAHGDSDLHADTSCGVVVVVHQPMQELLPDPLLGSQAHPSSPPCAENVLLAVDIFCIEQDPLNH